MSVQPVQAILALVGFILSLIAFSVLFVYLNDQTRYDRFFGHHETVYRVSTTIEFPDRGPFSTSKSSAKLAKYVVDNTTGVTATRIEPQHNYVLVQGSDLRVPLRLLYVDKNFFQFSEIQGYPAEVIRTSGVWLTKKSSTVLFGDVDPIGRQLVVDGSGDTYAVQGVVPDWPHQSHLPVEGIIFNPARFEYGPANEASRLDQFGNLATFLRFSSPRAKEQALDVLGQTADALNQTNNDGSAVRFDAYPIADIHLFETRHDDIRQGGDVSYLVYYALAGGLILILTAANTISFVSSYLSSKIKTYALHRIFGASPAAIFTKILAGFLPLFCVGAVVAVTISIKIISRLQQQMYAGEMSGPAESNVWLVLLATIFFTLFLLVSLTLAATLSVKKRNLGTTLRGGHAFHAGYIGRQLSLFVQIGLTVTLVGFAIISFRQFSYATGENLGYQPDNVYALWSEGGDIPRHNELLREISSIPGVVSTAAAYMIPAGPTDLVSSTRLLEQAQEATANVTVLPATTEFFDVLRIPMMAGRSFQMRQVQDASASDTESEVVINLKLVRQLGFTNPETALGHLIEKRWSRKPASLRIVGVIDDLRLRGAKRDTESLVIYPAKAAYRRVLFRVAKSEGASTILARVKEAYERIYPDRPFDGVWVGEQLNLVNKALRDQASVVGAISVVGLLQSLIGIVGFTVTYVREKRRAIATRKVLGAGPFTAVFHTLRRQLLFWLVAAALGCVLLSFVTSEWLSQFAVQIAFPLVSIVGSGFAVILIAFFAASALALRIANVRPIDVLREE